MECVWSESVLLPQTFSRPSRYAMLGEIEDDEKEGPANKGAESADSRQD